MDITQTIHDIIEGQVDARLEPARALVVKERAELQAKRSALYAELAGKMRELAKEADAKFRAWLDKRPGGKTIKPRDYYRSSSVFDTMSAEHFATPFDGDPREAFDALRRETLQRALRIASENPSRTAYVAVDTYLDEIDPAKEYQKRRKGRA